ncbi:hypothetical protein M406DRAFT_55220 [Cryphonectria parasitica EP155]|uniref:Uncharacterized protein n=1 Tax=Cryphonectria parasitica (strain ATCC 38755 / EP155) TaxID=660469 RepID=A0A9P4Y6I5_CRYP1|nr:uncharacterized protein M406DRAFT_55220 [Cryphonectria parasitica EP155]KAF3767395.1 hypothetical protein M406DRAFT_55220 [Cryphonectria parasitica EP155]
MLQVRVPSPNIPRAPVILDGIRSATSLIDYGGTVASLTSKPSNDGHTDQSRWPTTLC